jgi:hypothetical protein
VIKEVDADGGSTKRIRLTSSDGATWEVWEAPFPPVDQWIQEADALVGELANEWPAKRVQVMFVAEDASGGVRSQCPKTVLGKNKSASDMFGNDSRALTQSMEAQATTMERILGSANSQIGVLTKTVDTLGEQVHQLLDYIVQREEHEALRKAERGESPELGKIITEALQSLPALITVLEEAKAKKKAAAVTKKTNGQSNGKGLTEGPLAKGLPAKEQN